MTGDLDLDSDFTSRRWNRCRNDEPRLIQMSQHGLFEFDIGTFSGSQLEDTRWRAGSIDVEIEIFARKSSELGRDSPMLLEDTAGQRWIIG